MENENTQIKIDILSDIVNNNSLLSQLDIETKKEERDNTITIEKLLNNIKNNKQKYDDSMLEYEKEIVNKGMNILSNTLVNKKNESISNSQKNLNTIEIWKQSYDKLKDKPSDENNIKEQKKTIYQDNTKEERWCYKLITKIKLY